MPTEHLRGGSKRQRDSFHGLEGKPKVKAFPRWWHRRGKRIHNAGKDIRDKREADAFWQQWESEGCPVVKLGDAHDQPRGHRDRDA